MAYTVELAPAAQRALTRLDTQTARRIIARIEELGDDPRPRGVKRLKGDEGFLRIRVGDYRVIYRIENQRLVVLVLQIAHRREVYRQLR